MKNIIKKLSILLLINLVVPIHCSSQITLDSIEAKTTVMIFVEHEKYSIENSLLKQQISLLEELNQLYTKVDSVKKIEIDIFKEKVASDEKQIQQLKSTQKKTILGASVSGIILFILGLIL